MTYLTQSEFKELGFEQVDNFDAFEKRAEIAINLYTQGFYSYIDFETEIDHRKQAVKLATAYQVAYLSASGIMTADDKQAMSSVSIGRTSISFNNAQSTNAGQQFNLCLDAENLLNSAGFSLVARIDYDR
ncbi:DUF4054 domain-containing protein [Streptococcus iniae]|uniref:DUF4054 domain-containing protein n=1 Tax=Streptococcus iniae TaxID=1346 RepID=UPI000EFA47A3|nr:DUF4054 domain-containing protein [Streptococcus iniae]RMI79782.1 hypothetical protein DIX58_00875 [Streptococcus iniae]